MTKEEFAFIAVADLRLGITVDLDVGWLKHPFPKSRFKITSHKQIEALQTLGLHRVRFVPALTEPAPVEPEAAATGAATSPSASDTKNADPKAAATQGTQASTQANQTAQRQQARLLECEQRFAAASQAYRDVQAKVTTDVQAAANQSREVVAGLLDNMLGQGELAIRLLQKSAADPHAMHPVNVSVLCLLLGKALGMQREDLNHLGLAAFLHDIGKQALPERFRYADSGLKGADMARYQEHVALGVRMARDMGLGDAVATAIAQHHEMCDGSGFPGKKHAEALGLSSRILALVNQYDRLCNPPKVAAASTPHEALAVIFSRMKSRFDPVALAAFIRMMGVYPPGSMVQLQDERYAMVIAVNSSRPLKPRVIVQEPGVPRSEALVVDLEKTPTSGIRRSLKPSVMPEAALAYFAPPQNACYFFEPANQPDKPFQSM